MHGDTLEAIKQSAAIPSMPMIATRCYEMTSDPNCNYDRLIELLSTDAGMAADVLRLSNSALFGVTRQVTSLKQAVTLLGLRRIRDLVLSRYLVQKLRDARDELVNIHHFWRRPWPPAFSRRGSPRPPGLGGATRPFSPDYSPTSVWSSSPAPCPGSMD